MWLKLQLGSSSIRLTWGNSAGPYPDSYEVGLEGVTHCAAQVRQRLDDLAVWGATTPSTPVLPVLSSLAEAGHDLRYCLFDSTASPQAAHEIEAWVGEQFDAGDRSLFVIADPALQIPWGVLFDTRPPDAGFADDSLRSFGDFWCLKYSLAATLKAYTPGARLARQRSRCRLLSLVDPNLAAGIAPVDARAFRALIDRPLGATDSEQDCKRRVEGAGAGDTIFHFFGHHEDGVLYLGGSPLELVRFKMLMDDITKKSGGASQSCGFVFLNTCKGAAGKHDHSYVAAAERPGLCGLISAEAVVPRDFAARFACRFFHALFDSGESIGEIMSKLRHDPALWPLSLLYGCYAQPEYRIVPATTTAPAARQAAS